MTRATAPYIQPSVLFILSPFRSALLHRQRSVDRGLDIGLGLVDLRVTLAVLDLGGELCALALVLRGGFLERRADLLLVHVMAVGAGAGLERIVGGIGARGEEQACAGGDEGECPGFHLCSPW